MDTCFVFLLYLSLPFSESMRKMLHNRGVESSRYLLWVEFQPSLEKKADDHQGGRKRNLFGCFVTQKQNPHPLARNESILFCFCFDLFQICFVAQF